MSEPDVARTSRHLILSSKFETAGLAGLFGLEMANTAGSDDTHVDQDPQIICKWTRSRRLKRRVHNGWNRLPTGGGSSPSKHASRTSSRHGAIALCHVNGLPETFRSYCCYWQGRATWPSHDGLNDAGTVTAVGSDERAKDCEPLDPLGRATY